MGVMRVSRPTTTLDGMDDLVTFRRRLKNAIARRDDAASFSPDWDAAMSAIDELRADFRLRRLQRFEREASVTA
jgi:hypothetical protein